jgi:Uma2 family endonuclease
MFERHAIYIANMKLNLASADAFLYPDAMVFCHPVDLKTQGFIEHLILRVEVLSELMTSDDRGEKVVAYRQLNSLKEYMITAAMWTVNSISSAFVFLWLKFLKISKRHHPQSSPAT